MTQIYRKEIKLGVPFKATSQITFGYQAQRESFSIWFRASESDSEYSNYIVLGTGHEYDGNAHLVSSVVMPDGFTVFHLLRIL